MPRYRVTAELIYYTDQPDHEGVYGTVAGVVDELAYSVDDVTVTVSTVLDMSEGIPR